MSSIRFDAPPRDQAQLYNWLFRVSQDLNLALSSIDEGNMTPAAAASLKTGGAAGAEAKAEVQSATAALRGMIVKNAEIIESEMQTLSTQLNGQYTAISEDFGTLQETVGNTITAIPGLITNEISENQVIQTLSGDVAAMTETTGYIKVGILGHDDQGAAIIGIAIGRDVQYGPGSETVGQKEYRYLDTSKAMGVYTANGLSFYVGGTEVAYMRDQKLYINKATVADDFEQGPWRWERNANGLTLRYIGVSSNV